MPENLTENYHENYHECIVGVYIYIYIYIYILVLPVSQNSSIAELNAISNLGFFFYDAAYLFPYLPYFLLKLLVKWQIISRDVNLTT